MKCETEAPLAKSLFPVTLHRLCLHEIDECCYPASQVDPLYDFWAKEIRSDLADANF
jgi:hypothetical protein